MALRPVILLHVLLLRPLGGAVDGVRIGPLERGREGVLLGVTKNSGGPWGDVMSHHSDDGDGTLLDGLVTDDADFTSWPTATSTTTTGGGDDDDHEEGASWMSLDAAVVYPLTLPQLTLPGTHDSGAYRLGKQLMPDPRFPAPWAAAAIALAERLHVPVDRVITPWALTQTLDVAAQLRAGYRYVDLRAGWNGSHWCAHHTEVGPPVRTILRDVAEFAAEQPGEVVVVQVSHLDGLPTDEETRALAEMIGEELRGVLVPLPPPRSEGGGGLGGGGAAAATSGGRGEGGGRGDTFDVDGSAVRLHHTVGEMVKSGERVLVTFGDGDYDCRASNCSRSQLSPSSSSSSSSSSSVFLPLPYPYSHLWPPWTLRNTYADTADPGAMVRYNRQQVAAYGGSSGGGVPGSLFKVSWTLTTQTSTVLESVLPSHPKSLRQLNDMGEPLLAPFAEEAVAAGCRAGNILTVDFASTSGAVKAARAMNALPVGGNCTLQL